MHDIEAEDQRNAQPRFFKRDPLQPRGDFHAMGPDQTADPPGADVAEQIGLGGSL